VLLVSINILSDWRSVISHSTKALKLTKLPKVLYAEAIERSPVNGGEDGTQGSPSCPKFILLYSPSAPVGLVNQPKVLVASKCYCQHLRDLKCCEKQYLCKYFSHQTSEVILSDLCCHSAFPQHAGLISTCCHTVCPTHSQMRCKIVVKDFIQKEDLLDLPVMLSLTSLDTVCHYFIVTSDQVRQLKLQNSSRMSSRKLCHQPKFFDCKWQTGNYIFWPQIIGGREQFGRVNL
jgi:hypothetical protein